MEYNRVIALGTVGILAGTIAIIFSTRTGTAATVLTWAFAGLAVAAFLALPWSWYQRALSWLRSSVFVDVMLRRRRDRPQLVTAARWRFTADGLEAPQARRDVDRRIDHPTYVRSAGSAPAYVRVIALVPCGPLAETPGTQELRDRFLAWLAQTPATTLIEDLRPGQQDVTWKSWATPRRANLRADLTGKDQAKVPVASAVLELPSEGVQVAGSDPRYAELIVHVDLPTTRFARGLPDWRRRLTEAAYMPGELARFLQDLGLASPSEPPAQLGVLLRGRQSLTEIVSPGNIPALPASSTQIASEYVGLALAVSNGRTAEETAGLMLLDLSERDLHLNGTQAEMSGEIPPIAGPEPPPPLPPPLAASVAPSRLARALYGPPWSIRVAFSPDGRLLATAGTDKLARVFDLLTGEQLRVLVGHDRGLAGVAFGPDRHLLATASLDQTARVWDLAAGGQPRILAGHDDYVTGVAFSPDGRLLATASKDRTARVWNPASGEQLRTLAGHDDGLRAVAFSPDGRLLATASLDQTARVWDLAVGGQLRILAGHDDYVTGVAFSPDGRLLATASEDMTARVWDPATGEQLTTLADFTGRVYGVAFSPDGRLLATASEDAGARVWDPATGEHQYALPGGANSVFGVAFSPDGHLLATVGPVVKVWDLSRWSD